MRLADQFQEDYYLFLFFGKALHRVKESDYWSNNTEVIGVKMDGSVLEEKSSFKMLGLTLPSKFDWGSYIILLLKPSQ